MFGFSSCCIAWFSPNSSNTYLILSYLFAKVMEGGDGAQMEQGDEGPVGDGLLTVLCS